MADYLSPGVYVEEFDSGAVPMAGASTSTAGFIGLAERGPSEGLPQLVSSMADFFRTYGGYLSENQFANYRYLAYAVEQFFLNGGSRCFVMRVAPEDTKFAQVSVTDVITVSAKTSGSWGNQIRVVVSPSSKAKTQILAISDGANGVTEYRVKNNDGFHEGDVVSFENGEDVQYRTVISSRDNVIQLNEPLDGESDVVDTGLLPVKILSTREFHLQVFYGDEQEVFEHVSLNASAANYVPKVVGRSNLIVIESAVGAETAVSPYEHIVGEPESSGASKVFALQDGSDGSLSGLSEGSFIGEDRGPGKRTGIQAFIDNDEVSIMAVPGVTDAAVQLALVAHCEGLASRFAVLDIPRDTTKTADVLAHRNMFDTSYAALYHPWVQVFDPRDKRNTFIPPSGSVVGVYARSDTARGVSKAPANEVVRGCSGLSVQYNTGEQDILNPRGVNLIRFFTGQGIRIWGARTVSSNGLWKYVNVRRLFIFLEESIKAGTNWVVFEPNDEQLWARVSRTLEGFLTRVWRNGALMGSTPAEAFYVDIGRTTMTQDDIDNGRLICVIGVAPVKPAEFVIFRITQKTSTE